MAKIFTLFLFVFTVLGCSNFYAAGNGSDGEEIKLEAYQYGFYPDPLIVKKGSLVKLNITSRDVTHGLYIKEYGINAVAKKGKIDKVEFIADKGGEFDVVCSVYCGPGHSRMKGKLIVKE